MIRIVRPECFESNSSSMHTIAFSPHFLQGDLTVDLKCELLYIPFGEFGWEFKVYNDSLTKLQYALTMVAETEQYSTEDEFYKTDGFKMCNEMVKRLIPGCEGIKITSKFFTEGDYNPYITFDGYIDHQSTEGYTSLQDFLDDYGVTLEDFVFNTKVRLETGNDNYYIDDSYHW